MKSFTPKKSGLKSIKFLFSLCSPRLAQQLLVWFVQIYKTNLCFKRKQIHKNLYWEIRKTTFMFTPEIVCFFLSFSVRFLKTGWIAFPCGPNLKIWFLGEHCNGVFDMKTMDIGSGFVFERKTMFLDLLF